MRDIEVIAKLLFALAVSNTHLKRGFDLKKLLGVISGVGTIGVMEKQMQSVYGFEDELNIGSCYFYHSILSEGACQQGCDNGEHQNHNAYILSSYSQNNQNQNGLIQVFIKSIFEHFSNISGTLTLESEVIVRKAGLTAQIITQQSELINLILRRSEQSFQKMSSLVHKLCQILAVYNQNEPLVNSAFQQLDSENLEWAELQKSINIRKLRLNDKSNKFRQGKIKRFNRHHQQVSQIRLQNIQEYKSSSVKSEHFTKSETSFSTIGREQIEFQHKSKLKQEFFIIKDFIYRNLAPMMEYSEGNQVPKKIILNIYMRWNMQKNRRCLIEETGKIQMELTNQLKTCFPRISMNRKAFKGIQFRKEFMKQLQLTDRSPPFNEKQQLLDFQDPVNQLLKQANQLKPVDVQSDPQGFLKDLGDDFDLC